NNKGNIYINKTSPSSVLKAYYEQFQNDFSVFLKCRAKERVEGGRMVLTFVGRSDDPCSDASCYLKELLANALNDMGPTGISLESLT
ncbi:salicylate carboxymethyltransferase-like, partial [Trifolium medium]|nr:salicylate carboxymethyltransferase-like [Trifolium medium]